MTEFTVIFWGWETWLPRQCWEHNLSREAAPSFNLCEYLSVWSPALDVWILALSVLSVTADATSPEVTGSCDSQGLPGFPGPPGPPGFYGPPGEKTFLFTLHWSLLSDWNIYKLEEISRFFWWSVTMETMVFGGKLPRFPTSQPIYTPRVSLKADDAVFTPEKRQGWVLKKPPCELKWQFRRYIGVLFNMA